MAQVLEEFERIVEPLIPRDRAEEFKGIVRRKLNALAVDAIDAIEAIQRGEVVSDVGQELRDQLHPDSRIGTGARHT